MDRKTIFLTFIVGMMLLTMITAVNAARDDEEEEMVVKPTQDLSVAAFTEGISYIMAGGLGPILILTIAFVVGMIISHLVWGGF